MKRELKIRGIYECRCDERLQSKTKEFTRLSYTGLARMVRLFSKKKGEKTREGTKSGVVRLERMKHGSGIKGRDDRSSGIEILIADVLAKIKPTDPLILAKQAARRNLN